MVFLILKEKTYFNKYDERKIYFLEEEKCVNVAAFPRCYPRQAAVYPGV